MTTLHFKDLVELYGPININNTKYKNFENLILEGDHVVSLPTNWLTSSEIYIPLFYKSLANIYVPDDLVQDYKETTNWATVYNMIKPLSEYNDTNNLITRHNGYLDINITQNNCKTYFNGRNISSAGLKPLISIIGNISVTYNFFLFKFFI